MSAETVVGPESARPRVLKCHRDAARDVLAGYGIVNAPSLVDELAEAVVTAEDGNHTRAAIVTFVPATGVVTVYGPYASIDAARKSLAAGIGYSPAQRGDVFPMTPAPRAAKRKKAKA